MAKEPVEALTQSTLEKGGVLARLYFDVYGNDKDAVEGMLVDLSNRLTGANGVVYAVGSIERALETEDKKWTAAAEVKVLTKSLTVLVKICATYGPMAIEVLKPTEIKLSMHDTQTLLMETAQMSHEFTTTLLFRTLSPEDRKDLAAKLKRRAEIGKGLIEKAREEKKGSK